MTFTLTIELGNDAMQSANDIQHALLNAASGVSNAYAAEGIYEPIIPGDGRVRDLNGNTVGRWEVTE